MVQVNQARGAATTLGTLVTIQADGRTQWRDVSSGGSYMSVHDSRLHFGLGEAGTVDRVHVTSLDGGETVLTDVACCRILENQ